MKLKLSKPSCYFSCCCFPRTRRSFPSLHQEKLSTVSFEPRISLSEFANPISTAPRISVGLHRFSLSEIKIMTRNYLPNNLVGQGGFGPVYKGYIDEKLRPGVESQAVAVKVLDLHGSQGHSEWLAEVTILGQVKSPHLVKLIGYCCEEDQRVLVYEYMTRGNLDNHLFRRHSSVLPWSTRIKIAVGAAKGLAFLHRQNTPVIFRDFKASNILLDSDYTGKLSDFGLAKDGPTDEETHVSTRVMGTRGYAAPEYVATGHLTMRSDVYSFGVVLLELMTGRRSMDMDKHGREQSVVRWATPLLKEMRKVHQLMDPGLAGQYSDDGVNSLTKLVCRCLSHNPKLRPTMEEVVKVLEISLELEDAQAKPFVYVVSPQNMPDCRR